MAALAGAAQAVDFVLGEHLEGALRHHFDEGLHGHRSSGQGRIWIGVLSGVISQISTMSALETAMQPLVQSRVW